MGGDQELIKHLVEMLRPRLDCITVHLDALVSRYRSAEGGSSKQISFDKFWKALKQDMDTELARFPRRHPSEVGLSEAILPPISAHRGMRSSGAKSRPGSRPNSLTSNRPRSLPANVSRSSPSSGTGQHVGSGRPKINGFFGLD